MTSILKNFNPDVFIFIVFATAIIIVFITTYFFSEQKKIERLLSKLPNTSISGLKINELAKINGKVLLVKEPLLAPLTNRKCVYYILKIEQKKHNGKNKYWKTLVNEESIQEFFIEKNGDVVMVSPTKTPKNYKSYIIIDKKTTSFSNTFNEPSQLLDTLLAKYNINKNKFLGFNKSLRCTEAIIEVGEDITVAGIGNWKYLSKPIDGYSYSKIASLEAKRGQQLIITDLPIKKTNRI